MRKILVAALILLATIKSYSQVQEVWTVPYNYTGTSEDVATVNTLDASGNVYVAGINRVEFTNAFFSIIKYDTHGNQLWRRTHGGGDLFFHTHPVAIKVQGNFVYVMATNYHYQSIFFLCKYDLNGNLQWERHVTAIGASEWGGIGADMDVDPSGNVFVTGHVFREEPGGLADDRFSDYFIIKHEAATGNSLWARTYNGADPGNGINRPSSIVVDAAGNAYITGTSTLNGQFDIVTIKYAPDATRLWAERYEGAANNRDEGNDIALDANNNVIVTGFTTNANRDMLAIKYDVNGTLLWTQSLNGPSNTSDQGYKLIVDGNNNIYMTGENGSSATTIKFNSGGTVQWLHRISNNPFFPYGIALDVENNVYVVGRGFNTIETVRINGSTGSTKWAKTFEPDGIMIFFSFTPEVSIAVDANFNVFVCGSWDPYPSEEDESDFITIKYSQCNITCPANITVNNDPGQCGAIVTFAPVTTTGDCGATLTYSHDSGDFFPIGTTTVTVTSDETGAACSFTITVVDNEKPVITYCPSSKTVNVDAGLCYATASNVSAGTATATDNCTVPVSVTVAGARSDGLALNANYPVGNTIIKWTATDASSNTTTCSQTITIIDDQPPVISGESSSTYVLSPPNHTMRDVTINYTATDNCAVTSVITVTSDEPINGVGDGDTDPDWVVVDNHHVQLRAERSANGDGRTYTVTITAIDPSGNTATKTIEIRVPHDIKKPHSGQTFKVGSTVAFEGEFWDKPGNRHTAKWLIDETATAKASVTEPAGGKNGKVTGSYKFNAPGVYKLQMNITDQTGLTTYTNTAGDLEAIVVIYDPNGGHTYGGGYYNSPAGALRSDPSAAGKASYGFAMNYFKNSTYPKGEAQFEFKVGEFEFNALNFDYLVISNSMAQFKGTGKIIGGQSGVGFTMTVTDGQLDGTGIDKIRMKIYNKNNGTIIYDNQPGASDAALPIAAVGPNSVIVIQGTNGNPPTTKTTGQQVDAESKTVDGLELTVYPNPASNYFNILVSSNGTNEKIVLHVFDQHGRLVEAKTNVSNGSIVRIGDLYRTGIYYVRVIQGKQHKEQKLIKLSD